MNVSTRVLDILFRRVSPYQILTRIHSNDKIANLSADRALFRQYAVSELPEYSLDEHNEIYRKFQYGSLYHSKHTLQNIPNHSSSCTSDILQELSLPEFAFHGVLSMAEQVLTQQVMTPMCKIEQVFLWRELYLLLGQDLFVCAYLAQHDLRKGTVRDFFAWPAILDTNHIQLNNLLQKGLAENHQHLYGSSQTFALSWCSMMNYPQTHDTLDKTFGLLHQPFVTVAQEERLLSTSERVRYACLCRYILFCWLRIRERSKEGVNQKLVSQKVLDILFGTTPLNENTLDELFSGTEYIGISREELISVLNEPDLEISILEKFSYGSNNADICEAALWALFSAPYPETEVLKGIPLLRMRYGAKIPQRKGHPECLDYALDESLFYAAPDAAYRSLAGERKLLYDCFQHFLQGDMDARIQYLFYLYLMLKALVRSELIQVNQQVGFRNFSNYQDRKDSVLSKDCYYTELLRMAVNGPINEGHVISLESRISPKGTINEFLNGLRYLDEEKMFSDMTLERQQEYPWEIKRKAEDIDHRNDPNFFVYHFIKQPDESLINEPELALRCRHHDLRRKVRRQAIALAATLNRSSYFAQRIRGIDSASHEIGCPPEVFAHAFRYLRSFQHTEFYQKRLFTQNTHHLLSVTYHAGEDFLDIASALRTIDEAVVYLEMKRGDRLGHALGLGVNPTSHYDLKGRRIYIRKQDRLDDLIWLLFRSRELNTRIEYNLARKLEDEAYRLLSDIYGDILLKNKWQIGLREYYRCMSLRADDPVRYISMKYKDTEGTHKYEDYAIRKNDPNLQSTRKQEHMAGMYYYYHYDKDVKIRGSETIEVIITPEYMDVIRQAQNCLQAALSAKGIVIECNPSSNVLIGTFGEYHTHPIFRFNTPIRSRSTICPESDDLQVCVNTDDLGVFDTSQSFEYALLYQALYEAKDNDGNRTFTEGEILQYLESIRQSSFTAIFPKA